MGCLGRPDRIRNSGPQYVDNVHLGWWVAGDITAATDLNEFGNQFAQATYSGHAIGNVASFNGETWKTYVAGGDLAMTWNFGERSGDLTISRFDQKNFSGGLTFSGDMNAPGQLSGKHFEGDLHGIAAKRSRLRLGRGQWFVRQRRWKQSQRRDRKLNVGNNRYEATGIFAGSRQ